MKQFSDAQRWLGELDCNSAAALLTAASDVALIVSDGVDGVIRDVSFGSEDLAREVDEKAWIGQRWSATVAVDSRPKIDSLLKDAAAQIAPRWRHVNQRRHAGEDLPMMYAALGVGQEGNVLVVGRSLQPISTLQQRLLEAQQTMEREYSRLRQAETRQRLLFQVASEAVIIVEAPTRKVLEANPAALALLGNSGKRVVGRPFPEGFDADGQDAVDTLLGTVRATGRTDSVRAKAADGGREYLVSVSLFREETSTYFLVRLALAQPGAERVGLPHAQSKVLEVVDGSPDAFLVTDTEGRVVYSNRAFLDMAQLATAEQARGESLERWLGRPGVDLNLLTAHLREHNSVRLFATTLRGEYGSTTEVEICAVAVPEGEQPCLGFTLRDVGPRLTTERRVARERPRSVEQLTELVGRVPLKDLVRESSDMIERLCIEAALVITGDNRASAAEILGLSRQSLYAKLRRYGLGDLDSNEPADDDRPEAGADADGTRPGTSPRP